MADYLGKRAGKALGQISGRASGAQITPKEKAAFGFKGGGKVTRSIDGRATKGLTRGSRRT